MLKKITEWGVGEHSSIKKSFTKADIICFSKLSEDFNPIHIDEDLAKATIFGQVIVHGMLSSSLISAVIGNHLPGNGAIYLKQELKFLAPVFIGELLTATITIKEIQIEKSRLLLDTQVIKTVNNKDIVVIVGEALVKI